MIIVIVIVIVIALVAIGLTFRPTLEGMKSKSKSNGLESIQKMFPFHNPFNDSFYNKTEHQYKILAHSFNRQILNDIIGKSHIYTSISDNRADIVDMLDQYAVDFAVAPELSITPSYKAQKNVRFVASLYSSVITIIAPNDTNIIDLGDIKHYTCTVTIALTGNKQSPSYICLLQLLSRYPKSLQENVSIKFLNDEDVIKEYGDTYNLYFALIFFPL